MSNTISIAAVTGALCELLGHVVTPRFPGEPEFSDAVVTKLPFDEVKTDGSLNQVNVFLYQITPNPAWRGNDPRQSQLEGGKTPLALNLHYLVTAYGKNNDDLLAHRLLGRAMSLLHDYAILSPATIAAAITSFSTQLAGSNLAAQVERVRVTMQVLNIDEMSKLWTMFQAKFRASAAYVVSVVLIDSALPASTPLPVLSRSIQVFPKLVPPVPMLTGLTLPKQQPSARLGVPKTLYPVPPMTDTPGDALLFTGQGLDLGTPELVIRSLSLNQTMPGLTLTSQSATSLGVQLPLVQNVWPAGFYTAVARLTQAGPPVRVVDSNALPFSIAPRVVDVTYTAATTGMGATPAKFTVTCSPQVWPSQRVSLLVMGREILADEHTTVTDTVDFPMPGETPPSGTYYVRLRVDDVDSLLISDYSATPLAFDSAQKVTVP